MLIMKDDRVILRDFIESDIEKRIYWETEETEWKLWDGPWETENLTEEEERQQLETMIRIMNCWAERFQDAPDTEKREFFQICTVENEYIGWCTSYGIDENYSYSEKDGKCTIGIDIPERGKRHKGYASHALCLFIGYLLGHGEMEIYTQTWSGNERMIHLAEKIGFEECHRKPDFRIVRGEKYDGLTFRLNLEKYYSVSSELQTGNRDGRVES